MRPDPAKITLSQREFIIQPLTLGQIRKIDKILKNQEMDEFTRSLSIIQTALERDNPQEAKDIETFELAMSEMGPTVLEIFRVGGMVMVKPGEE